MKKSLSHKLALLGGTDFRDEENRRYTLYSIDDQKILLSYKNLTLEQTAKVEASTGAMVITGRRWGHNMTKEWASLRQKLLWIIENTTIYVVNIHQPMAYDFEADIIDVRLNKEASMRKNMGIPFRTRGEATRFCINNNIKIRPKKKSRTITKFLAGQRRLRFQK